MQAVNVLLGCASALPAIFKHASQMQHEQPNIKRELSHQEQQQSERQQTARQQVMVPMNMLQPTTTGPPLVWPARYFGQCGRL
jgi:hypothetical protein